MPLSGKVALVTSRGYWPGIGVRAGPGGSGGGNKLCPGSGRQKGKARDRWEGAGPPSAGPMLPIFMTASRW